MSKLTAILHPTTARARQAALREPVWVIWSYDAATWHRYDHWAWQRAHRRTGFTVLLGGAWALIWLLLGPAVGPVPAPVAVFLRLAPLWILGGTLIWAGCAYRRSRQLHQARLRGPATIRIGPLAVQEPGGA